MKPTTPTSRALLALAAGLTAGILLDATGSTALRRLAGMIEPLGTIWVNAIRMTVIPLVVSLVVVGVAGIADRQSLGRLGVRTFTLFVLVLAATAALCAIIAPLSFAPMQIDANALVELRAGTTIPDNATALASLKEWLLSIVPANPIRAAVDGAMLPLFVFILVFALALRRVEPVNARPLLAALEAVKAASITLIHWIVLLAPIGVFALALGLGERLGAAVVGAIGYYVFIMAAMHTLVGLLMYVLAATAGRTGLRRFAAATAPAQIVGLSSRSSMAALPTMVQGADRLGVRPEVSGFVLPLAISSFRLSSPVNWPVGALFVAHLYGIQLDAGALAVIAIASVILNPAAPAVPSGGLFVQAPVYMAVGLPVEGLGILIAIDAIPDIFKTLLNVTADMSVLTVIDKQPASSRNHAVVDSSRELTYSA